MRRSIPLTAEALAAAETRTNVLDPTHVLSAAEAEARQEERRHHLKLRSLSLGIVAGVLVGIWALTGPELPWIVWPLLGIGLIAGLDAWRVLSMPPVSEADMAGAAGPRCRAAAPRDAPPPAPQRGRLAILNLFLIGVWIASGSDYFWPAWVDARLRRGDRPERTAAPSTSRGPPAGRPLVATGR